MRKSTQMEIRRFKVYSMWLWNFKEIEIAKMLNVNKRTVYRDLDAVRCWADEHKITFKEFRDHIQQLLREIMKEMKLDLLKVQNPVDRITLLRKIADIPLEMWKKLMPTEIKVEGFSRPEIPEEEFDRITADMEKRAPHSS